MIYTEVIVNENIMSGLVRELEAISICCNKYIWYNQMPKYYPFLFPMTIATHLKPVNPSLLSSWSMSRCINTWQVLGSSSSSSSKSLFIVTNAS